ncbi:hypothetical protein AB0L82_43180 [Nocardia sp. NPDC052001]|uniref:hypothetical protein n=1 Tax=Nocardia sp. NPDC052001 TaxID=3154853 RepID=UPI003431E4DF
MVTYDHEGQRRHRIGELMCERHRAMCAVYWPQTGLATEVIESCTDCRAVAKQVTEGEFFGMSVPDWGATEFGREHDGFHEAGHTVAAVMGAIPIRSVRLGSFVGSVNVTGGIGTASAAGAVDIGNGRYEAEDFAAFVWGGMRATRKWLLDQGIDDPVDLIDSAFKGAHDVAALEHHLGPHGLAIETGRERADELMTRHWPAVQAVAGALLREQVLSGAALARLLEPLLPIPVKVADPITPENEEAVL